MIWTRLIYGTAIAVALAGTAIYYGGEERATILPVDIAELTEATRERLMPFSYRLVTNTLTYKQLKWRVDTADTNRWMHGTNEMPYLVFDGWEAASEAIVNLEGLGQSGTYSAGPADYEYVDYLEFLFGLELFGSSDGRMYDYDDWVVSLKQSGLTKVIDYWGATNAEPAYIYEVQPAHAVGTANEKATLDWIDSSLLTVIPQYADHEQAVNGVFTNCGYYYSSGKWYPVFPMLTLSSVWTRLELPYVWTNTVSTNCYVYTNWVDAWTNEAGYATNATRIGTNLTWGIVTNITTDYTFTTGPLCTTNMLMERYKVASYLQWTPGPLAGCGWTNSTITRSTNAVWAPTNTTTDTLGGYHCDLDSWRGGIALPYALIAYIDYPAWWDFSATNRNAGAFYEPDESPTIDPEDCTGGVTTNTANHRPEKTFTTSGSLTKRQSIYLTRTSSDPNIQVARYEYISHLDRNGTNFLTEYKAAPRIVIPYNIAGIAVTADVYSATNTTKFIKNFTIAPTSTNATPWVGSEMAITNSIFSPTNYPFFDLGEYPFDDQHYYQNDYWCNAVVTGDPFDAGQASWGGGWSVSANRAIDIARALFKWQFSRCHP